MGRGFSSRAEDGDKDCNLCVLGQGQGNELLWVGGREPTLGTWLQKDPSLCPMGVCSPGRSPAGGGFVGRAVLISLWQGCEVLCTYPVAVSAMISVPWRRVGLSALSYENLNPPDSRQNP